MLLALCVAMVGGMAVAILIAGVHRRPVVGLVLIASFILVAWEYPQLPQLVSVAGVAVYAEDIVTTVLFVAGILSVHSVRRLRVSVLITSVLALAMVSLADGVIRYGLGTAVNEFRGYYYLIAVIAWSVTLPWADRQFFREFRSAGYVVGWLLVAVAAYHAVRYGIGDASSFVDLGDGRSQTGRPLVASQAFVAGLGAVLCLARWSRSRDMHAAALGLALLLTVLAAQHRTVWVAVAFGLVTLAVVEIRSRRADIIAAASVLAGLGVGLILAGVLTIPNVLADSATSDGTYIARTAAWRTLIDASIVRGPATVLLGQPFGTGFSRINARGVVETFSPHNLYVSVYLRVGLVGLGLLVGYLVITLVRAIRTAEGWILAVVVMTLVYSWTYSPSWLSILPLGAAAWYSARQYRPPDDRVVDRRESCTPTGERVPSP